MSSEASGGDAVQREIAALLLSVIGDDEGALAGPGAIREHALTERPTEDFDLFGMPLTTAEDFAAVVERAETTLRGAGYAVELARSAAQFARLHLSKERVDVERRSHRVVARRLFSPRMDVGRPSWWSAFVQWSV